MVELEASLPLLCQGIRAPEGYDPTEVDTFWMRRALCLADQAALQGEVPVGALVVIDGVCVAAAYNQPIGLLDPTAHAEILVLREAARVVKNYRLVQATLYASLEPCAMCAGAMINARIKRLVYAASEPRTGAVGSVFNVLQHDQLNHRCDVTSGLMAEVASEQMRQFFKARR